MGVTQERLHSMLRDCEDQSENSQVNDIKFVPVVTDPCESESVHLKQEECDVHTAQSNANMYSQTAD